MLRVRWETRGSVLCTQARDMSHTNGGHLRGKCPLPENVGCRGGWLTQQQPFAGASEHLLSLALGAR